MGPISQSLSTTHIDRGLLATRRRMMQYVGYMVASIVVHTVICIAHMFLHEVHTSFHCLVIIYIKDIYKQKSMKNSINLAA